MTSPAKVGEVLLALGRDLDDVLCEAVNRLDEGQHPQRVVNFINKRRAEVGTKTADRLARIEEWVA